MPETPPLPRTVSPANARSTTYTACMATLTGGLGGFAGFIVAYFVILNLPESCENTLVLDCSPAHRMMARKPASASGLEPSDLDPAGYPASGELAAAVSRAVAARTKELYGGASKAAITVRRAGTEGTILWVTFRNKDHRSLWDYPACYRTEYENHLLAAHLRPLMARCDARLSAAKEAFSLGTPALSSLANEWLLLRTRYPGTSGSVLAAMGDLGKLDHDTEDDIFFFAAHLDTIDNKEALRLYNCYHSEAGDLPPNHPRSIGFRLALWQTTLAKVQQLHATALSASRNLLNSLPTADHKDFSAIRKLMETAETDAAPRTKILADGVPADLIQALEEASTTPPMITPDPPGVWQDFSPRSTAAHRLLTASISRICIFGGFAVAFFLGWKAVRRHLLKHPAPPAPETATKQTVSKQDEW